MTDVDVTKLEIAEDTLEQMVRPLEDAALLARDLADTAAANPDLVKLAVGLADTDYAADDAIPALVWHADSLADLVDELRDALDHVQIALGRPYVWLLSRSS